MSERKDIKSSCIRIRMKTSWAENRTDGSIRATIQVYEAEKCNFLALHQDCGYLSAMNVTVTIIIVAVAAGVAALLTYFAVKSHLSGLLAQREAELEASRERLVLQKAESDVRLSEAKSEAKARLDAAKADYAALVAKLETNQKETLEATRIALQAENDKTLKAREESLKKEAEETIRNVTGGLNQSIRQMAEAFEAQKKSHAEELASIKTQFAQTARNFSEQSEKIGSKAEKLANALRHDNKLQGNWGELQLANIFDQEGLIQGRDYEREEYLRDGQGEIISNESTGKRMRPDFILHFPDNTDVIVDSKMNLDAYVDWYNAEDEEGREAAARRNLAALKAQVRTLTDRRYQEHVADGHKTLPYVIMYVSNYGALALAKQLEPSIVNDAFRQNVLVTTEETIMPFLRLIRTAWVSVDQVKNQEKIVKAASQMVERVSDLVAASNAVGDALDKAVEAQRKCASKLSAGGQSITVAARNVMKLGVPVNPKKELLLNTYDEDSLS